MGDSLQNLCWESNLRGGYEKRLQEGRENTGPYSGFLSLKKRNAEHPQEPFLGGKKNESA